MAELINLNRARKAREKAAAKVSAATNRAAHGLTKAERDMAKAERVLARKRLEDHERE